MTYRNLTPKQVCELAGDGLDTIRAMVRAERSGRATAHGVAIEHSGYADGSAEFCAATSLFRVTF